MIQTPQTFKAAPYLRLFENATEEEKASFTESTRIFADNGYSVGMIEGEQRNMKVTRSGDIDLLELIYKKSGSKK